MSKAKKNGQTTDVTHDVRRLIEGITIPSKQEKYQRRVMNFLSEEIRRQRDLFLKIMALLDEACFNGRDVEKFCDWFFPDIIERLFADNKLDFFLFVYDVAASDLTISSPSYTPPNCVAIRKRFVKEFFDFTGQSVERSIRFCLFLLEQYHWCMNAPYDRNSIEGCLKVFQEYPGGYISFKIITQTLQHSGKEAGAERLWYNRLLEASGDNMAARNMVSTIFGFYRSIHHGNYFMELVDERTGRKTQARAGGMSKEAIGDLKKVPLFEGVTLPSGRMSFTRSDWAKIDSWIQADRRDGERSRQKGEEIFQNFLTHEDFYMGEMEEKIRAIRESPRRGLRPNGADHVEILLPTFRTTGMQSIAFYPEGCTFPNTKIKVFAFKQTPILIEYSGRVTDFHVDIDEEVFLNLCHSVADMKKIFEFILVDILYRITVECREMRPSRQAQTESRGSSSTSYVGPYFRRLPEGMKASQTAMDRAIKFWGYKPPAGKTFVQAHVRGGNQLEYYLPTVPTVVYDEDDYYCHATLKKV